MSIINTVIEQYPQANGTIDVVERHTDHLGVQYMRLWKADGHDIEARASEHATELEQELAQAEINEVLNGYDLLRRRRDWDWRRL